jgi:bifunctional DNA-binding transcriptional regulator/antitoxin component of YhaV-PrlF toxin-antitoxin module
MQAIGCNFVDLVCALYLRSLIPGFHYSASKRIARLSSQYGHRTVQGYGAGPDLHPVDVRRKLGIGPGSVLQWEEDGGKIVIRRACRFSSEDIHHALFGERNRETRSLDELKDGIRRYVRKRYARR